MRFPEPWLSLCLVRCMSRSAAFLLASLLTACVSVATQEAVTLPPLFVCGHYPYDFEDPPIKPIRIPHQSATASATYAPLPPYPYEAHLKRLEPKTVLELQVASNGSVRRINVVQSTGFVWLDRSTADALRQWRFKPGIAEHLRIPVTFSLRCPKIAEEQRRNRIRE